jgi:hypothetical protein
MARIRRELARARAADVGDSDPERRRRARRIEELEAHLEALMAEEHSLRLRIDRAA